jgi:hypothetical protein
MGFWLYSFTTLQGLTPEAPFAREYSTPPVKTGSTICSTLTLRLASACTGHRTDCFGLCRRTFGREDGRAGHATTPHSRAASQLFTCQRLTTSVGKTTVRFTRIAPNQSRVIDLAENRWEEILRGKPLKGQAGGLQIGGFFRIGAPVGRVNRFMCGHREGCRFGW